MNAASPFLATVAKRALAALADGGPLLLLIIFGAGIADALGGGPDGAAFFAVIIYVIYHGTFNVLWAGETPGRKMFHIRLVRSRGDGELGAPRSFLRPLARTLWIVAFLPGAISARTPAILAVPIIIDLFLMSVLKWRQSTADVLCGTVVVNSPEVQPHRAPAGPMYSATDAEFGVPPRRHK